ncbi:MBL fold metallo-hydrolase [Halobacteria archaeon HArc-gm2]|nr:MBL fold metallo-hydrolase [Halobacteria archaeon HArc-gm2]
MAIGDVTHASEVHEDLWYVDTGMYGVEEYGSVYVIDAERPAVVDTGLGTNYERVLDAVEAAGIDPEDVEVIAATHVHLDHAGGAGFLVEEFEDAAVYVHEIGAPHLVDPERLWEGTKAAVGDQIQYYVEPEPVPEDWIVEIEDGDRIELGDHSLAIHHAPGHAPHQVVFHDPEIDGVFTADAAGIYSPSTDEVHVTSPPSNFDLDRALDDVETLEAIGPEWLLYGHFGPARTADRLDTYAEILSAWVADVEAARDELGDDDAVIERFQETVETPEIWGEEKSTAEVAMNVRGVLTYLDRRET